MAAALEAQAALETAVVSLLLAPSATGLNYVPAQVGRTFDGQPPPRCGNVFVSVWSDGSRSGQWRTALQEVLALNITVTLRTTQPYDRWVAHRDELELRLNRISELIGMDCYNYVVSNAAELLAAYDGDVEMQPVGFREGLAFEGYGAVEVKGPEWFHADSESGGPCGLAQTARFGGNRRIRRLARLR